MASDKEIREKQNSILFDQLELWKTTTESELRDTLKRQIKRTRATMTKEEIAAVEKEAGVTF